jgi:hypothetical protein
LKEEEEKKEKKKEFLPLQSIEVLLFTFVQGISNRPHGASVVVGTPSGLS